MPAPSAPVEKAQRATLRHSGRAADVAEGELIEAGEDGKVQHTNSAAIRRTRETRVLIAALAFIRGCSYFFGFAAGFDDAATCFGAGFASTCTDCTVRWPFASA